MKIPNEWYHDPSIQNIYNYTVEDILVSKNLDVPKEW